MTVKMLKERNGVQLTMEELRGDTPARPLIENRYTVIAKWKSAPLYKGADKNAAEKTFNDATHFGFARSIWTW